MNLINAINGSEHGTKKLTKSFSNRLSIRLSFSNIQDRGHAVFEHDDVRDGHHDEINVLSLSAAVRQLY